MTRKKMTPESEAKRLGVPMEIVNQRLESGGFRTADGDKTAPFGLAVLPQTTVEVGSDVLELADSLSARVVSSLRGTAWHSKLSGVLLCPLIMNPAIGAVEDFARYRRAGAVDVGSNIAFDLWMGADVFEKCRLLANSFAKSFCAIRSTVLSDQDRERVLAALAEALNAELAKHAQ